MARLMSLNAKRYAPVLQMVGKRYASLVVTGYRRIPEKRGIYMECKCDCGETTCVKPGSLRYGLTTTCGCRRHSYVTGNCAMCGEAFYRRKGTKYCSDICSNRVHQGYIGPVEKTCIECGSLFVTKRANSRMCSDKCRVAFGARRSATNHNLRRINATFLALREKLMTTNLIATEVRNMDTNQLLEELSKGLDLTVTTLTRLGIIWRELEDRGVDLTAYKIGIAKSMPLIASGRLAPEVLVGFSSRPVVLRYLEGIPLENQRKLASGELIPVYVKGEPHPVMMKLANIPPKVMPYVFHNGELRTPEEQRIALRMAYRRRKSGHARTYSKVAVQLEDRLVRVGRSSATIESIVTCLANAASPSEVTESAERPARTIAGKVTDEEKERIVAAAKAHGISESEMVRRAVLAMWLL